MITYEVEARIADAAIARQYESYMMEKHLRDVLASGCFVDATLERADGGRYRTRYRADSPAALERYLRDHTAGLRDDFQRHFPTGVELNRTVWTALASRDAASG